MKLLYLDCFAGISGDMFTAAMLDLGLDPTYLRQELEKLHLPGYEIEVQRVHKSGIAAIKFDVLLVNEGEKILSDSGFQETQSPSANQSHPIHDHPHEHHDHHKHQQSTQPAESTSHHAHEHRNLTEITRMIQGSDLVAQVKELSIAIFHRLGEAESKVHGVEVDQVHFHEVGGVDAIIDIVSAAIGMHWLNVSAVYASPLHLGTGFIQAAHGTLPIPAPATAELLRGVPVYQTDAKGELVTPTGAAILTSLHPQYGSMPPMTILRNGYGAGSKERAFPNVLRAILGDSTGDSPSSHSAPANRDPYPEQHLSNLTAAGDHVHTSIVLEANIDDMSPQLLGNLMERLLAENALDVLFIPVQMKKNRPGVLLQVLAHPQSVDQLLSIIFHESSTLGVRTYPVQKHMLQRETVTLTSQYGPVRIKLARLADEIVNVSPEYEDCLAIARSQGIPLKHVYAQVTAEATLAYPRVGK